MTPLWLTIARIGESCPQATAASFSAVQRAKWERVADYIADAIYGALEHDFLDGLSASTRRTFSRIMAGEKVEDILKEAQDERVKEHLRKTILSASGTSEMPPEKRERLERDGWRVSRDPMALFIHHAESVADTIDDLPMYIAAPGDTINMSNTLDEQGEAGNPEGRVQSDSPLDAVRRTDAANHPSLPAVGVEPGPASPSLPPWPKANCARVHAGGGILFEPHANGDWISAGESRFWRDAALAKIERLNRIVEARDVAAVECYQLHGLALEQATKRIAALERDLAEAKKRNDELLQEACEHIDDVGENLPEYSTEDGDTANTRERIECAGVELRQFRAALEKIRDHADDIGTARSVARAALRLDAQRVEEIGRLRGKCDQMLGVGMDQAATISRLERERDEARGWSAVKVSERVIRRDGAGLHAVPCPDCGHTRCGEDCVCNCDAARAEHEAAKLRQRTAALEAELAAVKEERDNALNATLDRAIAPPPAPTEQAGSPAAPTSAGADTQQEPPQ